jgi:arabinose-5-phosphate isomerase
MESEAIHAAAYRLSDSFYGAFLNIFNCKGKVILTGLGKPGHIGQKIASTMSSTGTPAFFIHPSEALHGDFGMMTSEDCLVAISNGGETRELLAVAKYAKQMAIPVIAITGRPQSTLAKLADHAIDAGVLTEADTLGLAPTSSSTVALAIGDALSVVAMQAKGMTRERFALLHPGGTLGRDLVLIENFMRSTSDICMVLESDSFESVVDGMNRSNFGIAAVVDGKSGLLGCVSDGDLRRILLNYGAAAFGMKAVEIMSPNPKKIFPECRAIEAISIMEEHKITALFVVSKDAKLVGLARLHDLLSAKII